jgi:hypothetical protein
LIDTCAPADISSIFSLRFVVYRIASSSYILFIGNFVKMCGIFAYLNYLTPKARQEIVDILINGLKRLEYRGYDSAGRS